MFLGFGRTQSESNIVRLLPLYSTWKFLQEKLLWTNSTDIYINIFGNILMFVPFGFLGWVFPKLCNFKVLIVYFLSTIILVEALQYFTRLGVFDIDDILLNSLGVFLGFLLFQKFEKWDLAKN